MGQEDIASCNGSCLTIDETSNILSKVGYNTGIAETQLLTILNIDQVMKAVCQLPVSGHAFWCTAETKWTIDRLESKKPQVINYWQKEWWTEWKVNWTLRVLLVAGEFLSHWRGVMLRIIKTCRFLRIVATRMLTILNKYSVQILKLQVPTSEWSDIWRISKADCRPSDGSMPLSDHEWLRAKRDTTVLDHQQIRFALNSCLERTNELWWLQVGRCPLLQCNRKKAKEQQRYEQY